MTRPILSGPYRTFRSLLPYETFLEFEGSTITIPMRARRSPAEPWMEEEIKLNAYMRLEVFPAYFNGLGTREFQFIIRDWDLWGKSAMLNRLFYGNPLGHVIDKDRVRCPVPVVVTFNVNNNYELEYDQDESRPRGVFDSVKKLEIRNITSHDFRYWKRGSDNDEVYSLPGNSIYWEIVKAADVRSFARKSEGGPVALVFHKVPPSEAQEGRLELSRWRSREAFSNVLGVVPLDVEAMKRQDAGRFSTAQAGSVFAAEADGLDPCEHMLVQEKGNTVLSPLSRPRTPMEIRWALHPGITSNKELERKVGARGRIRLVSPSKSLGTADQGPGPGEPFDSADFPARITYAINYNIFLNRERFVEDQSGIAIAAGADQIPPRDVTVAFDKPHIGHVLSRYIEFGNGHCTGMHEIPEDEYQRGVNFCRYWRTVPLDPNDLAAGFETYHPSRPY